MTKTDCGAPALRNTVTYNLAAIDYTRVIMAFLVVAIHTSPFTSFSKLVNHGVINYLARLGVPFFFFCNGFFLFRPELDKRTLRKNTFAQIKKLFLMYLMWTAIYIPLIIRAAIKSEGSALKKCLRFVRDFIFVGSYAQLWYLPAAMLSIFLVWYALEKGFPWHAIFFASGALYAIGLMYLGYYGLFRALPVWDVPAIYYPVKLFLKAISTTRNGLFFGFLFVALGAYFARHPLPPRRVCRIGFAVSMAAGFAEAVAVKYFELCKLCDMYIFLPFAVAFLFCALLQQPAHGRPNTKPLRKFSSLIYLVHYWFVSLYGVPSKLFGYTSLLYKNSLFKYCVVAACSVVFALIVMRLAESKHFAWLKRFY